MGRLTNSLQALLLLVVSIQMLPSAMSQVNCQRNFLIKFLQCVANNTLDSQHFLWLAREGKMGTKPPDLPAFTGQTCRVKNQLTECFKNVVTQYQILPIGCNVSDKDTITQFHKNVVITLDAKCSNPCRDQLISNLAECYSGVGVNVSLFLSNITKSRTQMLGNTQEEVGIFCGKQKELVQCLKQKSQMCPASPDILMATGIDVDALNNTIALLCRNVNLYLQGPACYFNRSVEEKQCDDTLQKDISHVEMQLQARNIEKDVYAVQVCRARLDHVRCDLVSLNARGGASKCPDAVVGLRRQQECTLIPTACRAHFKYHVLDMCDPVRFLVEDRAVLTQAGKQTSGGQKHLLPIWVATLTVAAGIARTWLYN